ncbi:hypothetical protein RF11_13152 [Thelohanellus kitauei]|uniref:Uncharacterized protein n=1 Tax=Thelohanellus kitauei TaxID=669202 RepID=A0A0C2N3V1_THEKT|nr:hypothetical protein RF11_13152 [Thelohanellus kitauei]
MDRISQNRCAVLFCTLLIVCWSREQIDVKTRPATDDEIPGIQPTILHDECGNVEVIRNHHQSDFILVLTKCLNATGPEKGAIYKYDESNTDFSLVELKTPNNTTIDIDQIIPSGDKMFCISKSQNIAFFIDENLKTEHLQPLVLNYTYVPHPDHPNMIIRYPTQSKVCLTS